MNEQHVQHRKVMLVVFQCKSEAELSCFLVSDSNKIHMAKCEHREEIFNKPVVYYIMYHIVQT